MARGLDTILETESDSSSDKSDTTAPAPAPAAAMVTQAAELGSDIGAYRLGKAFFKGTWGLSKDPARARYWLKKIADGECAHKHLNNKAKATAAEWLRALDD